MNLAPIILFTYKRIDTLICTIEALKKNNLANKSDLFIFSDGFKNEADFENVNIVRAYLKTINGFNSIKIFESKTNLGLASSIINGVTKVFIDYNKVIVLEDDLLTSSNFLDFMNLALDYYENKNIFSISGYSTIIEGLYSSDVYFTKRGSSWGWATWKNKWEIVDWDVKDYKKFKQSKNLKKEFNKMGSDMSLMLERQMLGKINSWAIRWCYAQFKLNLLTAFPATSKVENIGIGNKDATHTNGKKSRFSSKLDNSNRCDFSFTDNIILEKEIINQFTKPYSFQFRLYYKIVNYNIFKSIFCAINLLVKKILSLN